MSPPYNMDVCLTVKTCNSFYLLKAFIIRQCNVLTTSDFNEFF